VDKRTRFSGLSILPVRGACWWAGCVWVLCDAPLRPRAREAFYFALESGRPLCAEQLSVSEPSAKRQHNPYGERSQGLYQELDRQYGATYKVLEILQNFYRQRTPPEKSFRRDVR